MVGSTLNNGYVSDSGLDGDAFVENGDGAVIDAGNLDSRSALRGEGVHVGGGGRRLAADEHGRSGHDGNDFFHEMSCCGARSAVPPGEWAKVHINICFAGVGIPMLSNYLRIRWH